MPKALTIILNITIVIPVVFTIVGFFLTFGYELYYEFNGEYIIEQPVDYSPTNHEVSAEVHHDHSYNSVLNSNSLLHPHDEDRHS